MSSITADIIIKNDTEYRLFLYSTQKASSTTVGCKSEQNIEVDYFSADVRVILFGEAQNNYSIYSSVVLPYVVEDGSTLSFGFTMSKLTEDTEIPKLMISRADDVKYYNLNEVFDEDDSDTE